jgi:hypothetical protein
MSPGKGTSHYSIIYFNCQNLVLDVANRILEPGHPSLPEDWLTAYSHKSVQVMYEKMADKIIPECTTEQRQQLLDIGKTVTHAQVNAARGMWTAMSASSDTAKESFQSGQSTLRTIRTVLRTNKHASMAVSARVTNGLPTDLLDNPGAEQSMKQLTRTTYIFTRTIATYYGVGAGKARALLSRIRG